MHVIAVVVMSVIACDVIHVSKYNNIVSKATYLLMLCSNMSELVVIGMTTSHPSSEKLAKYISGKYEYFKKNSEKLFSKIMTIFFGI